MQLSEENQRLLEEKIVILEKELIIETRPEERFRLEQKIKALKESPLSILETKTTSKNSLFLIILSVGFILLTLLILLIYFIAKNSQNKEPEKINNTDIPPQQLPTLPQPTPLFSQLKIIGLGKATSAGEYLIELNYPIAEKLSKLRVEGNKPLTVTLPDFPNNNIFYSNIYHAPPTIKPNEQIDFAIGVKLSAVTEKISSQYRFGIESEEQKISLIVKLNGWVEVINLLIETARKKLSDLPTTSPEEEYKVVFDLIKQAFPENNQLIQAALTAQALQLVNRPQAAALAYFNAEEVKSGTAEQFLTGQQNPEVRTEIAKLYLEKQNVKNAEIWFTKAAEADYAPAKQQLNLLQQTTGIDSRALDDRIKKLKEQKNNTINGEQKITFLSTCHHGTDSRFPKMQENICEEQQEVIRELLNLCYKYQIKGCEPTLSPSGKLSEIIKHQSEETHRIIGVIELSRKSK